MDKVSGNFILFAVSCCNIFVVVVGIYFLNKKFFVFQIVRWLKMKSKLLIVTKKLKFASGLLTEQKN